MKFRNTIAVLFCWLWSISVAPAEGPVPVLTSALQVRNLSSERVARSLPAKISGVVTYVDAGPSWSELFVQDLTAGIFVMAAPGQLDRRFQIGQLVDVAGVSALCDFRPRITPKTINVTGRRQLPQPLQPSVDRLFSAAEDGQWAELKTVVRSGQLRSGRLFLNLGTSGGNVVVILKDYPQDWISKLTDGEVKCAVHSAQSSMTAVRR